MRSGLLILLSSVGALGCSVDDLDLNGRVCPCAPGWTCGPGDICVPGTDEEDAGRDAGTEHDSGTMDATTTDASPPVDGGPTDAPMPDTGTPDEDAGPGIDPPWWDSAWAARAPLEVGNGAGVEAPAGLQVVVALDLATLPGSPARDSLRVVRWVESFESWTVLARHVEQPPDSTADLRLWFALVDPVAAGGTDSTYWLYWGNASAADDDRPGDVFDFYDDFTGSSIRSDWLWEDPASFSGGELVLQQGASIRSSTLRLGAGEAVEYAMRVPVFSGYFWGGLQRQNDFVDGDPWMIWINRTWDPDRIWPEVKVGAIGHVDAIEGSHLALDDRLHTYGVERYADQVAFTRDHVDTGTLDMGSTYTTPLQIRVRSGTSTGPTLYVEWLRTRTVMRPAPTVTVGTPEPHP